MHVIKATIISVSSIILVLILGDRSRIVFFPCSALTVLVSELILVDDSIVSHKKEMTKLWLLFFEASNLDQQYGPGGQDVVVEKAETYP